MADANTEEEEILDDGEKKPNSIDLSFMLDGVVPDNIESSLSEEDLLLLGRKEEIAPVSYEDRMHPDNIDPYEGLTTGEKIKLRSQLEKEGTATPTPNDDEVVPDPENADTQVKVVISSDTLPVVPAVDTVTPPVPDPVLPNTVVPFIDPNAMSDEDKKFTEALGEDDIDTLEFWQAAEKQNPEKYGEAGQKAIDFLKEKAAKVSELTVEDENFDPDNSDELNQWSAKHQPKVSKVEARKIQQRRVIDIAKDELRTEDEGRFAKLEEQQMQIEKAPRVQERYQKFHETANSVIPQEYQDVLAKANADGKNAGDELGAAFGDETSVVAAQYQPLLTMGGEFIKLTEGTVKPDGTNPLHVEINKKITQYGQMMLSNPKMKDSLVNKQGQSFTPRESFNRLTKAEQAKHWTLSDEQVLKVMTSDAKRNATAALAEYRTNNTAREVKTLMSVGYSEEDAKKKIAGRAPVVATPKPATKSKAQEPSSDSKKDDVSPKATPRRSGNGDTSPESTGGSSGADTFMMAPSNHDNGPKGQR